MLKCYRLVRRVCLGVAVLWGGLASAPALSDCPVGVSFDSVFETGSCDYVPQGGACYGGCYFALAQAVSVCMVHTPEWYMTLTSTGEACGYTGLDPATNGWLADQLAQSSITYGCVLADGSPCTVDGGAGDPGAGTNPQCGDHQCAWSSVADQCWSISPGPTAPDVYYFGAPGGVRYVWAADWDALRAAEVARLNASFTGVAPVYPLNNFIEWYVVPDVVTYLTASRSYNGGAATAANFVFSGSSNNSYYVVRSEYCPDYGYWQAAHSAEGPAGVASSASQTTASILAMGALLSSQVGELGAQVAALVGQTCVDPLDPATCTSASGADLTGVETALGSIDTTVGAGLDGVTGALTSIGNAVGALGAWSQPSGGGGFAGQGLTEADAARAEFAAGWEAIRGQVAGYFSAALSPVTGELPCWSTHLPGLDVDFDICLEPYHQEFALLGTVLLAICSIFALLYVLR